MARIIDREPTGTARCDEGAATLSVIIPTLNEASCLPDLLRDLSALDCEIVVVDGGSRDGTIAIAREAGAHVVSCAAGRGGQLGLGAESSTGDYLLFLHADSRIGPELVRAIVDAVRSERYPAATFRLAFSSDRILYRLYALFSRFESIWTTFGDQGLLVSRSQYEQTGGFRPVSLFEDVDLLRRLRRRCSITKLPFAVVTSPRRFDNIGPIRTQLLNLVLMLRYLIGENPERLAALYYGRGGTAKRGMTGGNGDRFGGVIRAGSATGGVAPDGAIRSGAIGTVRLTRDES